MRRSRLALGLGAAVVAVTAAFTASSALGASSPAPAAPVKAASLSLSRNCLYPPQTKPAVTLAGPASVRRSRSFSLAGTVKYNACGLPSWPVGLYRLNNNQWQLLGSTFTNGSGSYSFSLSGISSTTTFQTRTLPWLGLQSATSNNLTVTATN